MNAVGTILLVLSCLAGVAWAAVKDSSLLFVAVPFALAGLAAARGIWFARDWGPRWAMRVGVFGAILHPIVGAPFVASALLGARWRQKGIPLRLIEDAGAAAAALAVVACFVARPAPSGSLSAPFSVAVEPIERFDLVDCGDRIGRVIGLPGEKIAVRRGDVYAQGAVARKPFAIQRRLWRPIEERDPLENRESFLRDWSFEPQDGEKQGQFRVEEHRLVTVEKGECRDSRFIRRLPGGDLRLDLDVTVLGSQGILFLEITGPSGVFTAKLSSQGKSVLEHRGSARDLQVPLPEIALEKGERRRFELWAYDRHAFVVVDGNPSPALELPDGSPETNAEGHVAFGARDLLLGIDHLAVWKDESFEWSPPIAEIPAATYAVAGERLGLVDRRRIEGKVFLGVFDTSPRIRLLR